MTVEQKARQVYFANNFNRARRWNIYLTGYQNGYCKALAEVARCLTKPNNLERIESINNLIEEYGNERFKQAKEEAGNGNLPANQRI